jgi:hypothetical protein
MDKEAESTEVEQIAQPVKPIKTTRGKTIILGLLIVVLVGTAAGGSYWWRDKTAKEAEKQQVANISSLQQTTASLKKQLAAEKAKTTKTASAPGQLACTSKAPDATTISNIEASITSGNTAALEGNIATSVNVIIAASEGLGAKTPTQAVTSITSFISPDPSSWDYDFSLSASTLSSYGKGSYSQYFPSNAVVGKATNKKVISFSFDCNAKISTVFLAANEDLLK